VHGPTNRGEMEPVPTEALAALDAAAGAVERLAAQGLEVHFSRPRFGRGRCPVRAQLRDEQSNTLEELSLLEAIELLSA
jgi:hypothetical protein